MAGPGPSEARFGAIFGGAVRAVRADAVFIAGFIVVAASWLLVLQWTLRLAGARLSAEQAPVAAFAGLLVSLVVASILNGVFYHRAARIMSGEAGSLGQDMQEALSLLPALLPIGALMSGPNLLMSLYGALAGVLHWPSMQATGFAVLAGFVVVIVNLVLILNYIMAQIAAVVQRRGPGDALTSSQKLISGHRWLTIGLLIVAGVVSFVPTFLVTISHYGSFLGRAAGPPAAAGLGAAMAFTMVELVLITFVTEISNTASRLLIFNLYQNLRRGRAGAVTADVFA